MILRPVIIVAKSCLWIHLLIICLISIIYRWVVWLSKMVLHHQFTGRNTPGRQWPSILSIWNWITNSLALPRLSQIRVVTNLNSFSLELIFIISNMHFFYLHAIGAKPNVYSTKEPVIFDLKISITTTALFSRSIRVDFNWRVTSAWFHSSLVSSSKRIHLNLKKTFNINYIIWGRHFQIVKFCPERFCWLKIFDNK